MLKHKEENDNIYNYDEEDESSPECPTLNEVISGKKREFPEATKSNNSQPSSKPDENEEPLIFARLISSATEVLGVLAIIISIAFGSSQLDSSLGFIVVAFGVLFGLLVCASGVIISLLLKIYYYK